MPAMRVRQAIATAIADEMRTDPTVIVFGEDIAEAEGPFKTTEGLLEEFGPVRVRDTPISEMAFTGAAVGAATMGLKPIVEIMFIEFLGVALDQLVTEGAKMRYLSNGQLSVPMVVRASVGGGLGFGGQHSQTLENWVAATPGLKVLAPSDAQSAYSLLRAAIQDPDPVMFLESRVTYAERGEVDTNLKMEIGKARVVKQGKDLTIVALGQMTNVAREAAATSGIDIEVIDLCTIVPWDKKTVLESVKKTGRLVVVEEQPESGGWGSEIVATVVAELFSDLKTVPIRITCPNVPVPYNGGLEARFLPNPVEVNYQIDQLMATGKAPQPWWTREGF
jgi:pyruvate dehydrogenase E1 component beta subunit